MSLHDLIGGIWARPVDILATLLFLLPFSLSFSFSGKDWVICCTLTYTGSYSIPRSLTQVFLFLTLTLTARFCEEVIYRGYLSTSSPL